MKDFSKRIKDAPASKWIKFAVVATLFVLWLMWIGNCWLLLLTPVIFDIYITKLIPWTYWKKSKSPVVRKVMEWVDAIVFALIAVYFINIFFFQNYQIPSSSLEKTLLVGDFLFVGKYNYGARVPNTPLSFPLAQHTLPILNCKSYIDWPQWDYKRLKGPGTVQRYDIVVFNFPAGDTVAINNQVSDYYTICVKTGLDQLYRFGKRANITEVPYNEIFNFGRKIVHSDQNQFGEIVFRPVDRRENYVKRCVGLPGDTLQIINTQVYIDGVKLENPKKMQQNYLVQTDGTRISLENFRRLNVSVEDQRFAHPDKAYLSGFQPDSLGNLTLYELPLTEEALTLVKKFSFVKEVKLDTFADPVCPLCEWKNFTYPLCYNKGWTVDNYGPIWIPKKGATIQLTADNLPVYERVIRNYENNSLDVKDSVIYINGKLTDSYTFKMDYFWMMGDNRHNSADSRSWGFVPEDHIVGKPLFIWLSLDKDRGWFDGKIRWSRLFSSIK
ncbi:MAG: S26 family signal peptidase [Bacteroidales bacterium]|jgi:signal peptidase I|nr:S26 family signal peptidase [Bacteroidales bacterium]